MYICSNLTELAPLKGNLEEFTIIFLYDYNGTTKVGLSRSFIST